MTSLQSILSFLTCHKPYVDKMASRLTRVVDFTQVVLQFPQLPSPFTTIFTVCARHIKLCQGALQALVRIEFKVLFPACRTGFVLSLESFTAREAEVGAATTSQVWVSEYQAAYQTFCLENFRRLINKLTVISSKCLMLWPAVRFCSSLSSQWCVGGWSFLLLSTFCLLCAYIQSQVNKLHHNSYQIIAVMTVCVNYFSNTLTDNNWRDQRRY